MTKDSCKVSVIMNCYNGEKYLREAIDSVLAQTHLNWELIFWDNQSTDRSADIARGYDDPRMKYFYAPEHTLLYAARNFAIAHATGELIAFLDVDDWWCPEKLECQFALFDDPEVGFACSKYCIVNEQRGTRTLYPKKPIPEGWVLNDLLADYPVGLLTLVIRRTAFAGLFGGCDPRFHVIGDADLVVRLATKWKMGSWQEPLAFYRVHGNNEGPKQLARKVSEYETWVAEMGQNSTIAHLAGYRTKVDELAYVRGQLSLDQNRKRDAIRHLGGMSWGTYKLKLAVLILKASL